MPIVPPNKGGAVEPHVPCTVRLTVVARERLKQIAKAHGYRELAEPARHLLRWALENVSRNAVYPQPVLTGADEFATKQATLRFTEADIARVDKLADARGHTRSHVLTALLDWAIYEAHREISK
jgi:hypothetical protein